MSLLVAAPAVVLGSRDDCRLSTLQRGRRNGNDRVFQPSSVMWNNWEHPRRRLKGSGYRGGELVRAHQDSFKTDEGNGLARNVAGRDPLPKAPDVAISHDGLAAQPSSGESRTDDNSDGCIVDPQPPSEQKRVGSDLKTLLRRFWKVAAPYWSSDDKFQARLRLGGVFALTLATTGISVGFNFLGRDFYNALSSKDEERFMTQLFYYLGAFVVGIPAVYPALGGCFLKFPTLLDPPEFLLNLITSSVFVLRDYGRETLSLRWRAWMTKYYMNRYFKNRTFYNIQSQSLIDNPDQRIVDDLSAFTGTALSFALSLFNSTIDLISFSGILYGIYPPLFVVLIVYSVGGTAISVAIGKGLVGLNFMQEKREADFRYGLVRVRENAESIAFYGGEVNEIQLLLQRFRESFNNYSKLLMASRNLDFFTSGYRYLIQLLPAAVVAPLYFAGKIEFGVINQSFSAFNHILGDFSVVVYQFQSLSAFSAVVDRLGEFSDILDQQNAEFETSGQDENPEAVASHLSQISFLDLAPPSASWESRKGKGQPLLEICNLTLQTPRNTLTLVDNLSLRVDQGDHLLIMGPSGSGKTSLLRAIAGLWRSGEGTIKRYIQSGQTAPGSSNEASKTEVETNYESSNLPVQGHNNGAPTSPDLDLGGRLFFVPQRPYMVLGSLRQQLLYPTWIQHDGGGGSTAETEADSLPTFANIVTEAGPQGNAPADDELIRTLENVKLGHLLTRCDGLNSSVEWSSILSLGEQQRLAFARLLLSRPALALMDESTSALDEENEANLYSLVEAAGVTFVSVGHRTTLRKYHTHILELSESRDRSGCNWALRPIKGHSEAVRE